MKGLALRRKRAWSLMLIGMLALSVFSVTPAPVQGGEVLDHLPEIQLARAWFLSFQTFLDHAFNPAPAKEECQNQPDATDTSKIPNSLWIKENSEMRSVHDASAVLDLALCHILLSMEQHQQRGFQLTAASVYKPFFEALSGMRTLWGEELLDGTKQPIRLALLAFVTVYFDSMLSVPDPSEYWIFSTSPCDFLKEVAVEGATVEAKYAAFSALRFGPDTCLSLPMGSEEALMLLAQRGDIGAAVQLSVNWEAENREALLNELATYLSQATHESAASVKTKLEEIGGLGEELESMSGEMLHEFISFWLQVSQELINRTQIQLLALWGEPLITLAVVDCLARLHRDDYYTRYLLDNHSS